MSDKGNSKQNYIKVAIGVLVALAGAEGADAAGYTIDPALVAQLKDLGLLGSLTLIAYLHFVVMPVWRRIADKLDPQPVDKPVEDPDAAVDEQPLEVPKRRETQPRLAAVRPVKE